MHNPKPDDNEDEQFLELDFTVKGKLISINESHYSASPVARSSTERLPQFRAKRVSVQPDPVASPNERDRPGVHAYHQERRGGQ